MEEMGNRVFIFPSWSLAIDWLFLQVLEPELLGAATGRILELQVNGRCLTSLHRLLLPADGPAGRGDRLETSASRGLHSEAAHRCCE